MSSTKVKERQGKFLDFYETPAKVTDGLLDTGFIQEPCQVLEPSAGKGAIIKQVLFRYPDCHFTAFDVQDFTQDIPFLAIGDFLKVIPNPIFDRIIANPPFSQAEEFIKHAHQFLSAQGRMAFLLRLPFIASVKRYHLLSAMKPSQVCVLSQRPKFGGSNIDSCDYAWIIWDRQTAPTTILDWIPPSN